MIAPLRFEKKGQAILTTDDWKRFAPPKSKKHWVSGRSALELAEVWCDLGYPAMPAALHGLLETRQEFLGVNFETGYPEHRIAFDGYKGEPRNADLALTGTCHAGRVAMTIEAKSDETFGATISNSLEESLEVSIAKPESNRIRRIEGLARSLFTPMGGSLPKIGALRYQLLTAVAGTLQFAISEKADVAVLVIHEFVTDKTSARNRVKNQSDLAAFIHRLARVPQAVDDGILCGPFSIPGAPLFKNTPPLFIGKIVTTVQ